MVLDHRQACWDIGVEGIAYYIQHTLDGYHSPITATQFLYQQQQC